MNEAAYVAVDWGTSSFRLWLVDRAGRVLAVAGVVALSRPLQWETTSASMLRTRTA